MRLVEQHGGESVVLTLGPAEAEEQLRDAMAIGIDRGHPPRHRRRGVGSRGDGRRDRRGDPGRRGGVGPVRPDLLRQRVGRLGRLPGRAPRRRTRSAARARPGSRASPSRAATVRCEQEARRRPRRLRAAAARRSSPCSKGSTCRATRPCPGGCGPGSKPLDGVDAGSGRASRLERSRLVVPEGEAKQAEVLGHGAGRGARGRRAARADRGRVDDDLVLVEHADGVADRRLAAGAHARARPRRRASTRC